MWNPETYRDTDFGLAEGETFEPLDDEDDAFRPAPGEPYVQTVLGPIRSDEVGLALVREHLQLNSPPGAEADADARLDDIRAALLDLESFFTVNGRTVVSATPSALGRNAAGLLWLAQHAPVHIVGATGFPRREYLAAAYGARTVDTMRELIERDLVDGMDGTAALPGILVLGIGHDGPSPVERHALDLVADAHLRHGLPVLLDLADASMGGEMVGQLFGAGVEPGRVIVGGGIATGDAESASEIGETGAYLLFDGIASDRDEEIARSIARLASDGLAERLLVSHGYTRRRRLTGYGGRPGLSYVIEHFAVMLLEAGLDALEVRRILIDNAASALTIRH
jgi:phosphotriesterase-related protein